MNTVELQIHRVRVAIRDLHEPNSLAFRIVSIPIVMNMGGA
jgi:hypothetical protein